MSEQIVKRFEESIARFQKDPGTADPRDYDWWGYEGFIPVAKKAMEVVAESGKDALQVRKYEGIGEDGHTAEVWFRVYDLTKKAVEGVGVWTFNLSYPCPPFCGGG